MIIYYSPDMFIVAFMSTLRKYEHADMHERYAVKDAAQYNNDRDFILIEILCSIEILPYSLIFEKFQNRSCKCSPASSVILHIQ